MARGLRLYPGVSCSLMTSGTPGHVMSPSFPDDSIQNFCLPWWNREKGGAVARGRLLWAIGHPILAVLGLFLLVVSST